MPTPDLKYIPGKVPAEYGPVPVSAGQMASAARLCVVVRKQPDPVGGHLVLLRDAVDVRVYLGCLADAGGKVREWVEVWVQAADGLQAAPPVVRDALTNAVLDDRWDRQVGAFRSGDMPNLIETGWETAGGPVTWIDPATTSPVHPVDRESGVTWALCRDEAVLAKARLPGYASTLHRYLYLPELGAESPFLAVAADSPAGANVKPVGTAVGDKGLVPLNPGGGRVLVRSFSPVGLEAFVDLLGGAPWKGLAHGRTALDLELTTGSGEGVSDHLTRGGLFLGQQGRMGRLVESLHLKLRALSDAVDAVASFTQGTQRPLLNVGPESFQVRLGEPARGLPYLWSSRVVLADPGDAVPLSIPGSAERYHVSARAVQPSVYRPRSAGRASSGRCVLRIREALTERGEDTVLEGTLATDERLEAARNDLIWLRPNLKGAPLDLYARLDTKAAMAAGEYRFRTLAHRFPPPQAEQLAGAKGVPLPETRFEVVPQLSSPVDLYSLGVLAVRTLLVNPGNSLPVAVDEVLSLAREAGGGDSAVPLAQRIARLFDSDPRWLESLGPQRVLHEKLEPRQVLDMIPAALWFDTLAMIARMFPGMGPDSRAADLGDARHGGLHIVYDGVRADLERLLIRTRSLIVIDWRFNREIHAVVRGFLVKHGGVPPSRAGARA
ncbi:MAG: hypothetical protein IT437_11830 [Phycisphaerales bacterium]|nr:hypothetical protein [Phycisphaerales bacterium]